MMALTFDDLPCAPSPRGGSLRQARRITAGILGALGRHQAPATAFVNEVRLHVTGEVDERSALLQQWIDAGTVLGNHTFSHADLNGVSVDAFLEEIVTGELITRRLMEPQAPYPLYFRHPYTHTGDTGDKKREVDGFLIERGYRIAPYTVDSQDHVFDRVYLESRERGDRAVAGRVCDAYAAFVVQATAFAETISREMFGREIPQILLLHANSLNAECLHPLLESLRSRQYEFVSLQEALADAAYAIEDTFVTRHGPSWLWRWNKSQGMGISFRDDPEPPGWVLQRYQEARTR